MQGSNKTNEIFSLKNFTQHISIRSAEATVDEYERNCIHFFKYYLGLGKDDTLILTEENALGLKKEDVFSYIAEQHSSGLGASIIRLRIYAIKKYYRYLITFGLFTKETFINVFDEVELPKQKYRKQKVFLKKDTKEIIETFRDNINDFHTLRNFIFILICATTGARRKEIAMIKIQDIDFDTKHITFYNTKNGKPRSIEMTDELIDYLTEYLPQRKVIAKNTDNLFISKSGKEVDVGTIDTMIRYYAKKYKLSLSFHAFRRGFATEIYLKKIPLRKIMLAMGHGDINMTLKYIYDDDADEAVRAYSYNDDETVVEKPNNTDVMSLLKTIEALTKQNEMQAQQIGTLIEQLSIKSA